MSKGPNRNRIMKGTLSQILEPTKIEEKSKELGSKAGIALTTGAKIVKQPAGSGWNYFLLGTERAREATLTQIKAGNYGLLAGPNALTAAEAAAPATAGAMMAATTMDQPET